MLHLYMIQTIFGVRTRLCKLQNECTPLAAASDNVYQLLAGSLRVLRILPPIKLVAMILLKVALNTKKSNQSNQTICVLYCMSSIWTGGVFRDDVYIYL